MTDGLMDAELRRAIEDHQHEDGDKPRLLTRYVLIAEYSGSDDTSHFNWSYSDSTPPWLVIGMLDYAKHRVMQGMTLIEDEEPDDA